MEPENFISMASLYSIFIDFTNGSNKLKFTISLHLVPCAQEFDYPLLQSVG